MRTHSLLLGSVTLSLLLWSAATPAESAAGPAAPTFELKWGNLGAGTSQFNFPADVASDPVGNVYVADVVNARIQKFDFLGNYITQWGTPGSGPGQFSGPTGVAIDAAGNVYVADSGNNRIQKFDARGTFLTQWGSFGSGNGNFNLPIRAATDAVGSLYVADEGNSRIQKFDNQGNYLTQWGSAGSGSGQFNNAQGVAADPAGNIYVVDAGNNRVQKFDALGNYLTQWGSLGIGNGQFRTPGDVAADAVGNLYVSDQVNQRVQKFSSTGTYLAQWGSSGSGDGQFNTPFGVGIDAAGNVYVADYNNHRIQKFDGAGAPLTRVPESFLFSVGSGPGSGSGQFNAPRAAATDLAGFVYVVDEGNNRVQKFSSTGTYISQWGSTGAGNGQFNVPEGVAVSPNGDIFVADTFNNRIQKFSPGGTYVAQWGTAGSGNGQFNSPVSVATDFQTNVYVADLNNNRIQKFDGNGTYLAQWGSLGSGNGQFDGPSGVATDPAGNVYVVDLNNNRIQKFNGIGFVGTYLTQWGSLGGGNGQFDAPYTDAVDAAGNVYVADFGNNRIQEFTGAGTYLCQWGSLGSFIGEFNNPAGVAVDAAGSVYVADMANNRYQKFVSSPLVALVSDVGNDQGRQAALRFLRSSGDSPGSGATIAGYEIYRRIDPLPEPAKAQVAPPDMAAPGLKPRDAGSFGVESAELAGWTYLLTAPAHGESEYNVVVPTLSDANATALNYSVFFVRAATSSPFTFYDSGVEYGYSIDNLPPPTPSPFAAAYASGATHLHWGLSSATDFAGFRLYRGASAGFIPGSGNLIAATPDTGYADVGPAGGYYKLSAVDYNGNESGFALVTPAGTTGVGSGSLATTIYLAPPRPNPSREEATIHFGLPRAEQVALGVYDVGGRLVRKLVGSSIEAGDHTVEWDLRDQADEPVRPGLYFLRLEVEGTVHTGRLAVAK